MNLSRVVLTLKNAYVGLVRSGKRAWCAMDGGATNASTKRGATKEDKKSLESYRLTYSVIILGMIHA